jgi:hypothetical protein
VFATGKIYGGSSQFSAVCYIFNSGSTPVTIISGAINDESGANAVTSTTCQPDSTPLAPGAGCLFKASYVGPGSAFDCYITAIDSAGLRGSLEIRDYSSALLQAQSLR